jgi:hypothetical protein
MTLYDHYKEIGYFGLLFCLVLWAVTGDLWEWISEPERSLNSKVNKLHREI